MVQFNPAPSAAAKLEVRGREDGAEAVRVGGNSRGRMCDAETITGTLGRKSRRKKECKSERE
eukprot:2200714-Rhodomonas_salina.3